MFINMSLFPKKKWSIPLSREHDDRMTNADAGMCTVYAHNLSLEILW